MVLVVGGLDVLGRSKSGKRLEVKARGEEFTARGLWSSGVLVACSGTSPGVAALGGGSSESGLLLDCGVEVIGFGLWVESSFGIVLVSV